jgi:arylsulfatase A
MNERRNEKSFSPEQPNVVFLMADDMGYGDLGCYNEESKIPTPNMDQLAEEGVRFTDAHASSAVCTPSRYSILTGRYCWRTDLDGVVFDYEDPLIDEDRMTVASLLKNEGYATAAIGKWHLGMGWQEDDAGEVDFTKPVKGGPCKRGFDYFFGIRASLDLPPYCFIENDRTVGIPEVEKDPYHPQQREGPMVEGWKDSEVGPRFTEKATDFLTDHLTENPDQPFFLYFPTSAPHRPCVPPDFLEGKSDAGPRGDMVHQVDWMVGEVRNVLQEYGVLDDTLFIVTSDNGGRTSSFYGHDFSEYYGHKTNGDWRGQKADIWDGGHREPLIARWPKHIEAGIASDETVCLSDLLATIAGITGASLPENAGEDSYDMSPLLSDGDIDGPIREATIHQSGQGHLAVRKGPWKMVLKRGSGGFTEPESPEPEPGEPEGQLYNLEADPGEKDNLWLERQDIVYNLREILTSYQKKGKSVDM